MIDYFVAIIIYFIFLIFIFSANENGAGINVVTDSAVIDVAVVG